MNNEREQMIDDILTLTKCLIENEIITEDEVLTIIESV